MEGGEEVRYNTEEEVLRVMEDDCICRYNLAKQGALIMRTSLASHADISQADLNYLRDILTGDAPLPDELDDATRLYIEELKEIRGRNPS